MWIYARVYVWWWWWWNPFSFVVGFIMIRDWPSIHLSIHLYSLEKDTNHNTLRYTNKRQFIEILIYFSSFCVWKCIAKRMIQWKSIFHSISAGFNFSSIKTLIKHSNWKVVSANYSWNQANHCGYVNKRKHHSVRTLTNTHIYRKFISRYQLIIKYGHKNVYNNRQKARDLKFVRSLTLRPYICTKTAISSVFIAITTTNKFWNQ